MKYPASICLWTCAALAGVAICYLFVYPRIVHFLRGGTSDQIETLMVLGVCLVNILLGRRLARMRRANV
jgi:hypothetical protein